MADGAIPQFQCLICGHIAHDRAEQEEHFRSAHSSTTCDVCNRSFATRRNLTRHLRVHRERSIVYPCELCGRTFATVQGRDGHQATHGEPGDASLRLVASAHRRSCQQFRMDFEPGAVLSIDQAFVDNRETVGARIEHEIRTRKVLRASIILHCKYIKIDPATGQQADEIIMTFRPPSRMLLLQSINQWDSIYSTFRAQIMTRDDDFIGSGSGWTLAYVVALGIELGRCALSGSGQKAGSKLNTLLAKPYLSDIPSPDHQCFLYAVANGHMKKNSTRNVSLREEDCKHYIDKYFNLKGLKMPMSLDQISKFERQNKKAYLHPITVWMWDSKQSYPIYQSTLKNAAHTQDRLNLLLLPTTGPNGPTKGDTSENTNFHYVYINDLKSLLKLRKGPGKYDSKEGVCSNCFSVFASQQALDDHAEACEKHRCQKIETPVEGDVTQFTEFCKKIPLNIIGFADFEASLSRVTKEENAAHFACEICLLGDDDDGKNCKHKTSLIHRQEPTTYSILFVDSAGKKLFERTESSDENLMDLFFQALFDAEKQLMPLLMLTTPMRWSAQQETKFRATTECYMCLETFGEKRPVRDHNHYDGKYLGAACNECNLKRTRQLGSQIPLLFHNFSGYDSHFILKALGRMTEEQDARLKSVAGLPYNTQKFRTVKLNCFAMLDSLNFLQAGLGKLVENLVTSNHNFALLRQSNLFVEEAHLDLLLQKGIYPYERFPTVKDLEACTVFPPIDDFYSCIRYKTISQEEWQHGKNVFERLGCENMLQYTKLYCALDVYLLAECFTKFRCHIYDVFTLDIAQYISLAAVSFAIMLKTTKVKLENLFDLEKILFLENNIRGGHCFVATRYATSSSLDEKQAEKRKHVGKPDENVGAKRQKVGEKSENVPQKSKNAPQKSKNVPQKSKKVGDNEDLKRHLVFLDVNNLYGRAMCYLLPTSDYMWVPEKDIANLDFSSMSLEQETGFICEVTLAYPQEIHEKTATFVLAPENKTLFYKDLSPHSQKIRRAIDGKKKAKLYHATKMYADFRKREKYVLHYASLKLYLSLGMVLEKCHRVLSFKQTDFMAKFVKQMAGMRNKAKNVTEKNTYKLIVNSIYGKFLMQKRSHLEVKMVRTEAAAQKYNSDPNLMSSKILGPNLTAFFLRKKVIKLDQLFAIGFSILELSKYFMYTLFYRVLLPSLGGHRRCALLMSDTDCYVMEIKGFASLEEINTALSACMDNSNLPEDHPQYSAARKSLLGYLKDECAGNLLEKLAALRAKTYSLQIACVSDADKIYFEQRAKGLARARKDLLTMDLYEQCINTISQVSTKVNVIQSKAHEVTTSQMVRVALSSFDDKR